MTTTETTWHIDRDHSERISPPSCRFCGTPLEHTFVDLGTSPLANNYLPVTHGDQQEPCYPLHVYVCARCLLVQAEQYETAEALFSDYAYFSSYSDSWLQHAKIT